MSGGELAVRCRLTWHRILNATERLQATTPVDYEAVQGRELAHLEQVQIEVMVRNCLHTQDPAVKFRWQPLSLPPYA